jgi:hypothetical protein
VSLFKVIINWFLNQAWMFVNVSTKELDVCLDVCKCKCKGMKIQRNSKLVLTLVLSLPCFTSTKLRILTQELEERVNIANLS